MSGHVSFQDPHAASNARSVAASIRETIAHFFDDADEETAAANLPAHTLRDIGIDRTTYANL